MVFSSLKFVLGAVGIERVLSYVKSKYKCDYINYKHHELSDDRPPTSLLLLGKTGHGKSSLGNTILRNRKGEKDWFTPSDSMGSETKVCKAIQKKVFGRDLVVVDTPGLTDTKGRSALTEIAKILMASPQGYDALLIVLKYPSKMTPEEVDVLTQLESFFGKSLKDHALVVMTGGDLYKANNKGKPFEEYIKSQDCYSEERFGGKWLLFDNNCDSHDEMFEQTQALIKEVDNISKENYGRRYTNEMFEVAEEILKLKEKPEAMQAKMAKIVVTKAAKSLCFPAAAKVTKYPGLVTDIEHVTVGDQVLSVNESGAVCYTEVYMEAHTDPEAHLAVCKIQTRNHLLQVSAGHYIQVNEEGCYKMARDMVVGDMLFTQDCKNPRVLVKEMVISIENGIAKGIYNPMTMNGLLLVDGVLATCYDEQFYPSYSHFFMGAIRCLYQFCPRLLAKINESKVDGIPKWSWQVMNIWK